MVGYRYGCGIAIVAEKVDGEWKIYAKEGIASHDKLLSLLGDDGLKFDRKQRPHIRFEYHYPGELISDIYLFAYKKGWYPVTWIKKKVFEPERERR